MIPTYGSFRPKLPASTFSVATIAGTTTSAIAGNYNFYIQLENRVGRNLLSDSNSIAVAAGDGVRVTINPSAIATGEEVFWIVVSAEKDGNPQSAIALAAWKAREDNQVGLRSLPVTIDLTTDAHFQTYSVATNQALPQSNIISGKIALVTATGNFYRYETEASNGQSYGVDVEAVGKWVRYTKGGFNAYVADNLLSSDSPFSLANNPLPVPDKLGDVDSSPLRIWLNNGYEVDGNSPIVNGRYSLDLRINGFDYSSIFANKIKYILRGYCDRDTGVLNTAIATTGEIKYWSPTDPITLPEDLPRNQAGVYDLILSYSESDMVGLLPDRECDIAINVVTAGENVGKVSAIANKVGTFVQSDSDRLLIVPGEFRLGGVATVKMTGSLGFEIDSAIEQPIAGLLPNTPNQIAVMSGSANGFIKIEQDGYALGYSEVVRAIIGTQSGFSQPIGNVALSLSNSGFSVTIENPVDNNNGIVRSSYPDALIADNDKGLFTPTKAVIFVQIGGTFYQSTELTLSKTELDIFTFADLSSFTTIQSLPIQSDPYFSLFDPLDVGLNLASGTITGLITAWVSYYYDANNLKATSIRHDTVDCIPTATSTLGEMISDLSGLFDHLDNYNNPHQLTRSQLGAASETEFTAHKNNQNNPHQVTRSQLGAASQTDLTTLSTQVTMQQTTVTSLSNSVATLTPLAFLAPVTVTSLPLVLTIAHHGNNLICDGLTGQITIPNNVTSFPANYQVLVSFLGGEILIEREDGITTDLHFSNDNQYLKSTGEVLIRRVGSTNVFFISGNLEA